MRDEATGLGLAGELGLGSFPQDLKFGLAWEMTTAGFAGIGGWGQPRLGWKGW